VELAVDTVAAYGWPRCDRATVPARCDL